MKKNTNVLFIYLFSSPLLSLSYFRFFSVSPPSHPITSFPPTSASSPSERTPRTADSSKKPYSGRRRRRGYSSECEADRDATSDLRKSDPPPPPPCPHHTTFPAHMIKVVPFSAVRSSRTNFNGHRILNNQVSLETKMHTPKRKKIKCCISATFNAK